MADNWYIVLELEFDPPIEDEKKIEERIVEKAKLWSSNFNHYKYGAQYRTWNENIPTIRKEMIGPNNIRQQLASEACAIIYGPVDNLLKIIGRRGKITDSEGENISKKQKVSVDVVKKRADFLGIPWVRGKNFQAIYEKYYKTKPAKAGEFDGLKQSLLTFGVHNLYEFLVAGTPTERPSKLPCDKLLGMTATKKKNYYRPTSVDSIGTKLCNQCELTFKDEASKEAYDNYLEYEKRKEILDKAKSIYDVSGVLSTENFTDLIDQLTCIIRNRELAKDILEAFCIIEKISYTPGGEGPNIKVCRCGCSNDVSDGRKVCSRCGLDLTIKCPRCGVESDANINVCKCGFRFANLDIALACCEQAKIAIDALDFAVAKANLDDAERYWPKSKQVSELRTRLDEYQQRVGKEVEKMRQAMTSFCYCEANKQYTYIKKLFPSFDDPSISSTISQAIADAQAAFAQAQSATSEKDVLELCAKAYERCNDLPGVKELMGKYPPAAATGFSVCANPNTRGNIISWAPNLNDKSLRYVVVRSSSGWIRNVSDGDVEVYRGSAASCCDKNIEPGVAYYYNVFVERAGIVSAGASGDFKEIVNLFEIASVSGAAGDSSINLVWDALPKNATAEIYQVASNGAERHIASCTSNGYLVSDLTNDTQYRFRVALSYVFNGRKAETKGASVLVTPTRLPVPVDTLRVKPGQGDLFEAYWYDTGFGEVKLFSSPQKPKYKVGDVVSTVALEREMRELQLLPISSSSAQKLKNGEKGVSFRYSGTELLYIVAVAVKSGTAVFGSLARASKGETVNIRDIRPVNGRIYIYSEVPQDATGFVVLYRSDRFPVDISDVKTVRKYIPIQQYRLNNAIVIDSLEEKKYYFSVFAEFKRDGEKDYSSGADYLFDNSTRVSITYSVSPPRRFRRVSEITLEFEADATAFTLPDIDVMFAVGNAPMFKSTAELFYSITSRQVNGTFRIRIPLPSGTPRDTYIKAFIKDDAAQARYQLRLKPGSTYKIT